MDKTINRIGIFCGSSTGKSSNYAEATRALAALLVEHNMIVVHGGAKVGLMGHLADAVRQHNGTIIGVMPKALVDVELADEQLSELHVVDTMSERKIKIDTLSDAFIMLPGAAGSLDEFFEMYTLAQLGFHHKPCAILNTDGYYDHLLNFLQHAVHEGFMPERLYQSLIVATDVASLLDKLLNDKYVYTPKWVA